MGYGEDVDVPTKVPIEWHVTAGKDSSGSPLLELKMTTTTKLYWPRSMGKENQVITNFILNTKGTWKENQLKEKA